MDGGYQWLSGSTNEHLKVLFCNYLSLGQYELARATLLQYFSVDNSECLNFLHHLITSKPSSTWLQSKTVPSTAHLLWLCLTDYEKLSIKLKVDGFPDSVWQQVEFALLLEFLKNPSSFSVDNLQDLSKFSETVPSINKSTLSINVEEDVVRLITTIDGLKKAIINFPPVGNWIANHIQKTDPSKVWTVDACYLQIIEHLIDNNQFNEAFGYLRYIYIDKDQPKSGGVRSKDEDDFKHSLSQIFTKMIRKSDQSIGDEKWKQRAYSSLLSIPENLNCALHQFLVGEDALVNEHCQKDNLYDYLFKNENLKSKENNQQFWQRYYDFVRTQKEHYLDFVLVKSCEHAIREEWDTVSSLLLHFSNLKPFVLLMTWHHFKENTNARTQLIKHLWTNIQSSLNPDDESQNTKVDVDVRAMCESLEYQIKLTWWCVSKLKIQNQLDIMSQSIKIGPDSYTVAKYIDGQSSSGDVKNVLLDSGTGQKLLSPENLVYTLLQSHSLIYVMQSYLHSIPAKDVANILRANKSNSEIDQVKQNLTLLHASTAIRRLQELIYDTSVSGITENTLISRKLVSIEKHLNKIEESSSFLLVCQILFSALFLKQSDMSKTKNEAVPVVRFMTKNTEDNQVTEDYFVVSRQVAELVVHMLQSQISRRFEASIPKHEPSIVDKQRESLTKLLQEADWRLNLIKQLSLFTREPNNPSNRSNSLMQSVSLFELMISSPKTLLIMSVRERNWKCCKDVINYFNLDVDLSNLAKRAEAFYLVRQKFESTKSDNILDITENSGLEAESGITAVVSKFFMLMDILVSVSTSSQQANDLLNKATELLNSSNFSDALAELFKEGSGPVEQVEVSEYTQHLKDYLERLILILDNNSSKGETFRSSFTDHLQPLPLYPKSELHSFINYRDSLVNARKVLTQTVNGLYNLSGKFDDTIESLLKPLTTSNISKSLNPPYMVDFMKYLQYLGRFLLENRDLGTTKFYDHLDLNPQSIVARMLFISKDHNRAEQLSQVLQLDLVSTVLNRIEANRTGITTRKRSSSNKSMLNNNSNTNQTSSKKTNQQQTITKEPKFPLTISEVEYIARNHRFVAVLASLLCSPSNKFESSFLSFALSESSRYPILHRWVASRARSYGVFQDVYLDKSFTNILRNLDGSVPINSLGRRNEKNSLNLPSGILDMKTIDSALTVYDRTKPVVQTDSQIPNFPKEELLPPEVEPHYISIFQEDNITGDETFFQKVLDKMILVGELVKSSQLADMTLINGTPDFILRIIVEKSDNKSFVWKYILRISDKLEVAKLTLRYLNHWELNTAQDMLRMTSCHLKKLISIVSARSSSKSEQSGGSFVNLSSSSKGLEEHHEVLAEVEQLETRLKTYREIIENVSYEYWSSWQDIHRQCMSEPTELVDKLLSLCEYKLARKIARQCKLPMSVTLLIEEKYLLSLLLDIPNTNPDNLNERNLLSTTSDTSNDKNNFVLHFNTVRKHLLKLGKTEALVIAQKLLDAVKDNTARLFLIQYLRENYNPGLTSSPSLLAQEDEYLSRQEKGIRALLLMPPYLQQHFEDLRDDPDLIIESLIMSEQITILSVIKSNIPSFHFTDSLVVSYAIKAINPELTNPANQTLSINSTNSTDSLKYNSLSGISSDKNIDFSSLDKVDIKPAILSAPTSPRSSTVNLSINVPHSEGVNTISIQELGSDRPPLWVIKKGKELETRAKHQFRNVPRHQLATDLLDFCEDSHLAGQTCLSLCDRLSEEINQHIKGNRLFIVNIIQQLLFYAKLRFAKAQQQNPDVFYAGAQDCDTYLARVDLLHQLLFSNVEFQNQKLSLSTFSDPQKSRQLRDKLIEQDRLELAIDVATKCNIEAEPAWAQLGISLLRLGKYNEAKEKFRYCLTPTMMTRLEDEPVESRNNNVPPFMRNSSSPLQPNNTNKIPTTAAPSLLNKTILKRIIKVLESGPPSRQPKELIARLTELKKKPPRLSAQNSSNSMDVDSYLRALQIKAPNNNNNNASTTTTSSFPFSSQKPEFKKKHSLDSFRYMQCIYYLQRYGAPEDLISFWVRHHLLEDALRYILNASLSSTMFLQVVNKVLSDNLLVKFKEILLRIDGTLKKWQPFLMAACKHFNHLKMYDLLFDFQVFMKDYIRAGFTCIKMFVTCEVYTEQVRLLENAKLNFTKGAEQSDQNWIQHDDDNSSEYANQALLADVSKYTKTINLQLETIRFFNEGTKGDFFSSSSPPKFDLKVLNSTLFGGVPQKSKIAEVLIEHFNIDLAWKILQEYQLPTTNIYKNAFGSIVNKQQSSKIQSLLKSMRGTLSDSEWDEIILDLVLNLSKLEDKKMAENFAKYLTSPHDKVTALIACKKFKAAYMEAVKLGSVELVQTIGDEALKYGMNREAELCEKYLQQQKLKQQNPTML
eukprot:TRINITY_DN7594_c0_g1_i1.p1 TRINITY_DN7594_c0_g1~~TRINITY_DN7594_c0_g1_i1.p1  ORF type:complete len:2393 (+),score=520.52 TRINITY_DN7594_c0_g1_i1:11-7189(+)